MQLGSSSSHPLARARTEAGLSVRALERISGVGYVTISHTENRRTDPKPETKARLAEALGATVYDLFPDDMPQFAPHPDIDPDAQDLRGLGLEDAEVILHLNDGRVDFVDDRGRVVATETAAQLYLHTGTGSRIEIRRNGPAGRRPRGRRVRRTAASSSADDDGPAPPREARR